MSPSTLTSQAVVFATAMAAFSGTLIVLAVKTQKSLSSLSSSSQFQANPLPVLRPCLSSGEKNGRKKKKSKRVKFAEDVIEPTTDNEEFRRQKSSHGNGIQSKKSRIQNRGMPENRVALYNGILRDRVVHRYACTY